MHYGNQDFRKAGVTGTTFNVVPAKFAEFQAANPDNPITESDLGLQTGFSLGDINILDTLYGSCADAPPPSKVDR
jgi:hypothetical protein